MVVYYRRKMSSYHLFFILYRHLQNSVHCKLRCAIPHLYNIHNKPYINITSYVIIYYCNNFLVNVECLRYRLVCKGINRRIMSAFAQQYMLWANNFMLYGFVGSGWRCCGHGEAVSIK